MPLYLPPQQQILRLIQPSVGSTLITTSEAVLGTLTIPGGSIGPTGELELDAMMSITTSANLKTVRVRLDGLAGTAIYTFGSITTNSNFGIKLLIVANASESAQFTWGTSWRATDILQAANAPVSSTINMTTDRTIVVTGQAAAVSENMACLAMRAKITR